VTALVALGLVAASALYQTWRIWPYTPLARVQSVPADAAAEGRRLRLVISNVLMTNRDGARWLRVVRDAEPDVVVAVETDAWWAETTGALAETHPHTVQLPQDDTYGMCVYSRFPIESVDVRHLVEKEVPSLFLTLRLPAGDAVRCVFLHPRPPRPDMGQDSTLRDAELVLAAREIADWSGPVVVAGDLNDVAWSDTTHLFQKLSGLLDPRVGRGLFATFHAAHVWLRYPLDHVFHSDAFALVDLARLPAVGSDHFPMCITLAVCPDKEDEQEAPDADADDVDDAAEIVGDAAAFKADETPEEHAGRVADDV
jgi:endonuclease/exonuclease/phosphatase (EEP) superfamily protein YafD